MCVLLYCCALYNIFFCFKTFKWQSIETSRLTNCKTDKVLNLAMNIDTHCFGALEAVTGAQTSPHVLAWKTGSDYSYCFASKLLTGSVVS